MRNLTLSVFVLAVLISCKDDDVAITISASNFMGTVREMAPNGSSIGTVNATTNAGTLTFSITSQTPAGGMAINAGTGALAVANGCVFDFETNPTITATIQVANGGVSENVTATVNLTDITEWTGPTVTFIKANNTDVTLATNQDRLTSNVWLTRDNTRGIFNIAQETGYTDFVSPTDTEWSYGTLSDICSLSFEPWENVSGSIPPNMVDEDMVVHLITDDIYIDVKFTFWQSGGDPAITPGQGGGFTYVRSTP